MKGLLLKEWYAQKYSFWMLFANTIALSIQVLLLCSGEADWIGRFAMTFLFASGIYGMIFGSIDSDQKNNWTLFAGALPCTAKQIVLSKYAMAGLAQSICFVLCFIFYLFGTAMHGTFDILDVGYYILAMIAINTVPFFFCYTTHRTWIKATCYSIFLVIGASMPKFLFKQGMQPRFSIVVVALLACVGIVGYLWSMKKTIEWYQLLSK